MRWKGIIFVLVVIGLIILLGLIFSDTWLERKIEETGSALNGARVDIDDLQISLIDSYVRWDRLQITDPGNTMMNQIETGECEFDIEFIPLLSNKVIIESFTIKNIHTDTERTEDGAISDEEKIQTPDFLKETSEYLEKEVASVVTPQFSSLKKNVNVDSLIKLLDLQSIPKIKNLQTDIEGTYESWDNKFNKLKLREDLKEVESQIKSIDINNIKTADQYLAAAKKVDGIYNIINTWSKDLLAMRKELDNDLTNISSGLGQVDKWIQDDYNQALSMARIPDIDTESISKLIFGDKVVNQITSYLSYIATAREYGHSIHSEKPEKKSPPRLKGQDIYFYNKNARPDFWIKKLDLSGKTNNEIQLAGMVSNIVSDQRQIGQNTQISINGNNSQGTEIALTGVFDYLTDKPKENFELKYSGFSLADYQLSNSKLLPNKITKGIGTVSSKLQLLADQIEGEISFTSNNLNFDMSPTEQNLNEVEKVIQSVVENISSVNFSAKLSGTSDNLKFTLNSNLDNILMDELGSIVNKKFEKAKADITGRVDSEINKYKTELENLVSVNEGHIQSELATYEQLLANEKNRADDKKKEIEEIYKKEKSKLEDKIKNFFK